MEVALNAVRIHGGYGYSTEYDVEVLPRRAADDRLRGHERDPAQRHRRSADQARGLALTSPEWRRPPPLSTSNPALS
jgi:alkylation response protein AidB-like acyl-CoA dehydrogenase